MCERALSLAEDAGVDAVETQELRKNPSDAVKYPFKTTHSLCKTDSRIVNHQSGF